MKKELAFSLFFSFVIHLITISPFIGEKKSNEKEFSSIRMDASLSDFYYQPKLELKEEKIVEAKKVQQSKTIDTTKVSSIKKANWQSQVKKHLQDLKKQDLLYPKLAIQNGWEGITQVLVVLDNQGNIVASRVEGSSNYEILDQAALRAIRQLKPLSEDAPREFVLPVSFKLSI